MNSGDTLFCDLLKGEAGVCAGLRYLPKMRWADSRGGLPEHVAAVKLG